MKALLGATARKEVIFALLLLLGCASWFAWRNLSRHAWAQVDTSAGDAIQIRAFLDAGQFAEAVVQVNGLLIAHPGDPGLLKYKALAQLLARDSGGALETADAGLAAGAKGTDQASLLAIKAVVLADYEHQQGAAAATIAADALAAAGDDPDAIVLSRLACAAAARAQLDPPNQSSSPAERASQIRQMLEPLCQPAVTEPQSAWRNKVWRHGLALLSDSGFLAADAGEASAESRTLDLLRQSCPPDVWACYFSIPAEARAAVQAGTLDDHARVALLTASGFLYLQSGDRFHCDAMYRRAIQVYGRLLEGIVVWTGRPPIGKRLSPSEQVSTQRLPRGTIRQGAGIRVCTIALAW